MNRLAIALFVFACGAFAAQESSTVVPLDEFRKILVQENGRIKPMDTYARSILLQISSKSTYERRPAVAWLADTLFLPEKANDYKIFRINNPEVVQSIGIREEKGFRYSFKQLEPHSGTLYKLAANASKIERADRTPVEKEFLKVYSLMGLYVKVSRSFGFAFPHGDFNIAHAENKVLLELNPAKSPYAYIDIAFQMPLLRGQLAAVLGKPEAERSEAENELLALPKKIEHWGQHYKGSNIPIIPYLDAKNEAWIGPLEALGQPSEMVVSDLKSLTGMANAYRSSDSFNFNQAVKEFNEGVMTRINDSDIEKKRDQELFYYGLDPFYRAQISYGLAFLFSLCSLLALRRIFYWSAILVLLAGFVPHVIGIAMRMMILDRPPITNLFDTFIFVSGVSVLLGLVLEFFNRKSLGLITASISGLALLLISNKYAIEGDTLGVLVAVLDSNFWLATHVTTISLGYTGCCVAGVIGHIWILQALVDPTNKDRLSKTYGMIFGVTAFGLIFSFIGTVLGGIWADQSWGRFWGWDPKENGALLIVLWCAILFHAKMARFIGQMGFAVGSILGIIVVMLAWFGINLLGVGLHSYGFTSGIAKALFTYIAIELAFIGVTIPFIRLKLKGLARSGTRAA